MTKNEIAKKLKLSPSYVTMLFKGQRKLTDALLHKVHKVGLQNEFRDLIHIQGVRGSNPLLPTIYQDKFSKFPTVKTSIYISKCSRI
jgi:hypothetical protein